MRRLVHDAILPSAIAIALAFVIQASVAKPYEIPTESMVPTIEANDRIIANRLIYRLRDPRRGDVIVFNPPQAAIDECRPPAGVPFVKRVIGLPGDRIEIRRRDVLVNGIPYDLPAAIKPNPLGGDDRPQVFPVVPKGHLFVLGDNRPYSCDSHQWRSSPVPDPRTDPFVPEANIIGQAEGTYWPISRARFLD